MGELEISFPLNPTGKVLQLEDNRLIYKDEPFEHSHQWLADEVAGFDILEQRVTTVGAVPSPKPRRIISNQTLTLNSYHIYTKEEGFAYARASLSDGLLPIDGQLQPALTQMLFLPLGLDPNSLSPRAAGIISGEKFNLTPRRGTEQMAIKDTGVTILKTSPLSFVVMSHCQNYRKGSNNVLKYQNSDNGWIFTFENGVWEVAITNRNTTGEHDEQLNIWNQYYLTRMIGTI